MQRRVMEPCITFTPEGLGARKAVTANTISTANSKHANTGARTCTINTKKFKTNGTFYGRAGIIFCPINRIYEKKSVKRVTMILLQLEKLKSVYAGFKVLVKYYFDQKHELLPI
jgi:hypothetical protein